MITKMLFSFLLLLSTSAFANGSYYACNMQGFLDGELSQEQTYLFFAEKEGDFMPYEDLEIGNFYPEVKLVKIDGELIISHRICLNNDLDCGRQRYTEFGYKRFASKYRFSPDLFLKLKCKKLMED